MRDCSQRTYKPQRLPFFWLERYCFTKGSPPKAPAQWKTLAFRRHILLHTAAITRQSFLASSFYLHRIFTLPHPLLTSHLTFIPLIRSLTIFLSISPKNSLLYTICPSVLSHVSHFLSPLTHPFTSFPGLPVYFPPFPSASAIQPPLRPRHHRISLTSWQCCFCRRIEFVI